MAYLERSPSAAALTPPLALCTDSIWLFLNCTLYNKTINVSQVFSLSPEWFSKLWNLKEGEEIMGTP